MSKPVTVVEMPVGLPPSLHGRLTVIETLYHDSPLGQGPTAIESRYVRQLMTDDLPFINHYRTRSDNWTPITDGETPASVLHVRNDEALGTQVRASDEEVKAMEAKVLLVAVMSGEVWAPFSSIRPGESVRVEPVSGLNYAVKPVSTIGPIRYTVSTIPA